MSIATENFLQAIQKRRTNYALNKDIKISDQRIQEIIEHCVKHVPSSFNSQAGRVKILLGGESDKFWEGTKEILRKIVPAEAFAATEAKMNGFASGYGTILFFEDQEDVKKLQDSFPSYADNFPGWSEHSNGMLQFAVWTAFSNEGLGCSLQHYTPLVNELVETEWKAPKSWKLIAQMPFGNPVAPAGDKEFKPLETRLQVYGKSEVKSTQETVKAAPSSNNATDNFLQAIQKRRTNYALSKDIKISDQRIQEIVETSVKHVPSSFNSQAGRVKILLGRESDKFWEGTKEILRKIVPAEAFAATEAKMNGFASGYGTILFFEDQDDVKKLQDGFPTYADNFPVWSEHSSGMLQFVVWTALSNEGLGASLQHYTPLVNELVETEWKAPKSWKLIAQMPFGHPVAPAGDKEFKPLETRLQVYGKDSQKGGKKDVQVTQQVAQVKGDGCCNIF